MGEQANKQGVGKMKSQKNDLRIVQVRDAEVSGFNTPWGFWPSGMQADGYGKKIQQRWKVQYADSKRWYRVYARCFFNVASFYTSRGYDGVEEAVQAFEYNKKKGI